MSKSGYGTMKGRPVEIFTESRIELMKEINKHEDLVYRLNNSKINIQDWPEVLAMVAAYCQTAVDGWYKPDEIETMEHMLLHHLKKIRGSDIVLTT